MKSDETIVILTDSIYVYIYIYIYTYIYIYYIYIYYIYIIYILFIYIYVYIYILYIYIYIYTIKNSTFRDPPFGEQVHGLHELPGTWFDPVSSLSCSLNLFNLYNVDERK